MADEERIREIAEILASAVLRQLSGHQPNPANFLQNQLASPPATRTCVSGQKKRKEKTCPSPL